MTDYRTPFRLGPLGKLAALPAPNADSVPATYPRTTAIQRSLTGSITVDVLGVRRAWEFQYDWRLQAEVEAILARFVAPPSAPLRLIDPVTVNLASLDASCAGGISKSVASVAVTAGTCSYVLPSTMPSDVDDKLDGAALWSLAAGQSGSLQFDTALSSRPPVLPSTLVSTAQWATGTTTATPFLRPYTVAGVALSDIDGSPTVLSGTWQRLTQTAVTMPSTAVSVAYGVKVATTAGARTVTLAAPLVVHGTLPSTWTLGGGAPEVVLMDMEGSMYQWRAQRQTRLTVQSV